jgi:hypothetical protein
MILQAEIDINRAWEISPYNGLAYGALIVVLCLVIWYFKNELDKANEYNKALVDRVHDMAEETANKITEMKQSGELINGKVLNYLEQIKERLNKI